MNGFDAGGYYGGIIFLIACICLGFYLGWKEGQEKRKPTEKKGG